MTGLQQSRFKEVGRVEKLHASYCGKGCFEQRGVGA